MKKILCLFFLVGSFVGCSGSSTDSSVGGTQQGPISGYVLLFDSHGNSISDRSGVSVSVSGSSVTAGSTATGKWVIPNISLGVHTFTFTKPGFGTMKDVAVPIVGGDTTYLPYVRLYQPPEGNIEMTSLSVINGIDGYYFSIHTDTPPAQSIAMIALSSDSSALAADPASAPITTVALSNSQSVSFGIPFSSFVSGSKIFATICPVPAEGHYFDPSKNKTIYPAVGQHSAIRSITIP